MIFKNSLNVEIKIRKLDVILIIVWTEIYI